MIVDVNPDDLLLSADILAHLHYTRFRTEHNKRVGEGKRGEITHRTTNIFLMENSRNFLLLLLLGVFNATDCDT